MEKNARAMDHIADKEQKNHVIIKYLKDRELKGHTLGFDQICIIREVLPGTDHIILDMSNPVDFAIEPKLKLSVVLARYIEIHCSFIKMIDAQRIEMKVDKIAIAKKERSYPRYPVVEEGFVKVTNIISSKPIIEANMFNIPTLVRVNFEEYQRKLAADLGPNASVIIDVFHGELGREFEVIKKLLKPIFIPDCNEEKSYTTDDPNFLDYSEEVDDQLAPVIKAYKNKQILSELLHPIVYINELDEQIPIGYVWIQTRETKLPQKKVPEIIALTAEMIERIKDANLMTTEDKFPVVDVSVSGLKLIVNNANLTNTLPKQKGFGVDIFFKMQAPLRMAVEMKHMEEVKDYFVIGSQIVGLSGDKKAKDIYYSLITFFS